MELSTTNYELEPETRKVNTDVKRHHEEHFTANPKANDQHQICPYIINESHLKEHENKGNDQWNDCQTNSPCR